MADSSRLTPSEMDLYPEYLDDHLSLLAINIENALRKLGAKPGEDYSHKDLMNWAIELTDDIEEKKKEWTSRNQ